MYSDGPNLFLDGGHSSFVVNDMDPIVVYSSNWDFSVVPEANKSPGRTFHSTPVPKSNLHLPFEGTYEAVMI